MNIKEIKEIIDLLKKSDVSELELEKPNGKLKVKMNISSNQPKTLIVPETACAGNTLYRLPLRE